MAKNESTACASAYPTDATMFGERGDLLTEARARIRDNPKKYVDHIYSAEEASDTSVLMLSGVPFEQLKLATNLPRQPLPMLTWQVLSKVPDFVAVAGAFLYGVFWITRRREEVAAGRDAAAEARR
jgi:formate dehydrogenase iron-sulfur subunit